MKPVRCIFSLLDTVVARGRPRRRSCKDESVDILSLRRLPRVDDSLDSEKLDCAYPVALDIEKSESSEGFSDSTSKHTFMVLRSTKSFLS